jgi:hypothetical protein
MKPDRLVARLLFVTATLCPQQVLVRGAAEGRQRRTHPRQGTGAGSACAQASSNAIVSGRSERWGSRERKCGLVQGQWCTACDLVGLDTNGHVIRLERRDDHFPRGGLGRRPLAASRPESLGDVDIHTDKDLVTRCQEVRSLERWPRCASTVRGRFF